jgi:hypothetical protein
VVVSRCAGLASMKVRGSESRVKIVVRWEAAGSKVYFSILGVVVNEVDVFDIDMNMTFQGYLDLVQRRNKNVFITSSLLGDSCTCFILISQ